MKKDLRILTIAFAAALAASPLSGRAAGYDEPNTKPKPEQAPSPQPDKTQSQPDSTGATSPTPKAPERYPADNTGRNLRDATGATTTPEDQSMTESDRKLVQRVRKSITDERSLSVDAQNVKIVSVNGKVTLRGPVKTPAEKDLIYRKANAIVGTGNVDDQLEVIR
jgi:hypothetical protein